MDILELKNSVGSFKSRLHIAKQRTSELENQMKIHRKKHGGERMEKQETERDRRNVARSLHNLKLEFQRKKIDLKQYLQR